MKRSVVLVFMLAGCVPPSSSATDCTSADSGPVCGPSDMKAPRRVSSFSAEERRQIVAPERVVAGVAVAATPFGAAAWRIRVTNDTDETMSVVWDESTFVVSTGESAGRLLLASIRRADIGKPQPPSPLPPHGAVIEAVLAEKLIPEDEYESSMQGRYVTDDVHDTVKAVRERRLRLLNGGRLHVTVVTSAGKRTWTGLVLDNSDGNAASRVPAVEQSR